MSRTIRRMPLALITIILTVLLLFSCLLGLKLGYLSVSLSGIVSILASHLLGSALPSDIAMGIADAVWDLRLPRILLALAVGMGLSLSGMLMQAMFRNPMSDPYIMGVSSGASLGAASAVFFGAGAAFGVSAIGCGAFLGALALSLILAIAAGRVAPGDSSYLLIFGAALAAVCGGITSVLVYIGANATGMDVTLYWLMGSVSFAKLLPTLSVLAIVLAFIVFFLYTDKDPESDAGRGGNCCPAGAAAPPFSASLPGDECTPDGKSGDAGGTDRLRRSSGAAWLPDGHGGGSQEAPACIRSFGGIDDGLGGYLRTDTDPRCGYSFGCQLISDRCACISGDAHPAFVSFWRRRGMNISVNHVSAGYGGKQVLKDVSISFESGQLTGIIGPNGCGKSTLLKCIYRLLSPWSGDIRIGDTVLKDLPYRESAKRVAVLAQHHAAGFDFDVEEVVLMGRTPYKGITEGNNREDRDIAHRAMRETGVETLAEQSFSFLSGGEQQRVMLARALTQETPCLILDEPTNHLDITYQLQIMDLVSSRHLTVLAAIHDLNIAAMYCDKIAAMKHGELVAFGRPEEVLTEERIWELYHVKAEVFPRKDGRPAVIFERGAVV